MDRLQAMEVFVRVAESASFTAAAYHLDLARSAVTRQVAALEAHLGVKLIARSTRRLTLTTAGRAYLERCREILDLVQGAESDIAGAQGRVRGPIRISVPLSFGIRHLSPLLADFACRYPEVRLDMDFNDRRVNLIEAGLDCALRITDQLEATQVARRLGNCRLVTVASPAYLAEYGEPRHPNDVMQHACLSYSGLATTGWAFMIDGQLQHLEAPSRFNANNGDVLLDATIRGLGISHQPSFLAAEAIRDGRLRLLLQEFAPPPFGLYAVFPSHRYIPHRVQVLVEEMAQRFGPHPYWDEGLFAKNKP